MKIIDTKKSEGINKDIWTFTFDKDYELARAESDE